MKKQKSNAKDELRSEYDLSRFLKRAVRGKYAKAYHAGTNLVPLAPDVHKVFPREKEVDNALRLVIELRKIGAPKARTG